MNMGKRKRCVVFSESDSDDDFQSQPILRAPNPSPNVIHTKRKKSKEFASIFDGELVDYEGNISRGKVQLTFEESCRMAKKKPSEQKPPKTLEHFFTMSASSSTAKNVKKEVAVDDFFSMINTSRPRGDIVLVPETPEKQEKTDSVSDDSKISSFQKYAHKEENLPRDRKLKICEEINKPEVCSLNFYTQCPDLPQISPITKFADTVSSNLSPHVSSEMKKNVEQSIRETPEKYAKSDSSSDQLKKSRVQKHCEREEISPSGRKLKDNFSGKSNSVKVSPMKNSTMMSSSKLSSASLSATKRKSKDSVPEQHVNSTGSSFREAGQSFSPKLKVETPKKLTSPSETITPSKSNRKAFWSFQSREGPRELGSRELPTGLSTCFKGSTFVITGILESIERNDAHALIERGGGRITKSLSKKTTYLIVGRDCGLSKLEKAENLGVKQLNEDEFFALVSKGFQHPESKQEAPGSSDFLSVSSTVSSSHLTPLDSLKSSKKMKLPETSGDGSPQPLTDRPMIGRHVKETVLPPKEKQESKRQFSATPSSVGLWVEKYRPTLRRQLVGQNGPASPANRLFNWLSTWQEHFSAGHKAKAYSSAPPWASGGSSDDGNWARAALLSGPPGIGKTTTAMVVCAELSLATIEMNASDTRSKRNLKEEVSEALGMRSLSSMFTGKTDAPALTSHVLIMDEVDGMAGNEDRGGMQELIGIIKTSKVPVICLCNDRQSPKVRSLANYCLDLRFQRPRVEQIKAAVLSLACRENFTVGSNALAEIITASNQDIRQVINSVQMWCMNGGGEDADIAASAASAHKNLRIGPFDVIRKVFSPNISGPNRSAASFADSLDLFFQDYSMGPMFVQENYVNVRPLNAHDDKYVALDLLAKASKAIATGDIVGNIIQSSGASAWSLLPVQAVFSSLLPGRILRGPLPGGPGGVSFPAWFGRNSTYGKNLRILSDLSTHLRLSTHGGSSDPRSVLLDYIYPLAIRLSSLLKEGDVDSVLETLNTYQLLREDMENVMDFSVWQSKPNLMKTIDSKVKSALTRAYNKLPHMVPYAVDSTKGGGGGRKRSATGPEFAITDEERDAKELLANDSGSTSDEDVNELKLVSHLSKEPCTSASKSASTSSDQFTKKSKKTTASSSSNVRKDKSVKSDKSTNRRSKK